MSLQEKAIEAIKSLNNAGAKGFITAESVRGEEPKVVAKFRSADEMFAYYKSLVECGRVVRESLANQPPPEVIPEATPEVEYITPTAEHVGQMVEVRDRNDQRWAKEYRLVMILSEERKYRFVVDNEDDNGGLSAWKQARVAVKR